MKDQEALGTVFELSRKEGLLAGSSPGAAVRAALEVASARQSGERVVTIFPDSFERYLSKRYLNLE